MGTGMVADVATLHKDISRLVFHPTCANPVFASHLISVTFLVCCLYYPLPLHLRKVPRFFLILSQLAYIRRHSPHGRRIVSSYYYFCLTSPVSSSFPHHAGTVISVEKCDAWIFLGDRPAWLGALRVGVMGGFFFLSYKIIYTAWSLPWQSCGRWEALRSVRRIQGRWRVMDNTRWVRNNRYRVYM